MSESNIHLGTSGWSYSEWEGPFYRKDEKSKLRAYASIFKIVEIDSTFYRNPSKGTVMGWLRYSPPDFIFTAKMPKLITHDKRLGLKSDVKAADNFLSVSSTLGNSYGETKKKKLNKQFFSGQQLLI